MTGTDPATLAPGTLVEATVRGVPWVRGLLDEGLLWTGVQVGGTRVHNVAIYCTNVRPVELVRPGCVQLDPEDEAPDGDVWRAAEEFGASFNVAKAALRVLRDEQAKPAEVAEPNGLGAVVRDARGEKWVRTFLRYGTGWIGSDEMSGHEHWSSIPKPVEVLSHGVNGDGSEVEVP